MDVTDLLESHHREVEDLFAQYDAAESDEDKGEIFEELADRLAAHTAVEERYFYPRVYVGQMKEKLTEAVEEHAAAKRVIAELLEMEASDPRFDDTVQLLQTEISHHVEEEETGLFPWVRRTFSNDDLQMMGDSVGDAFEALLEGSPRLDVPRATSEPAPWS